MTQPSLSRRGLILGLGAVIAAPAIVRASSLMAIKPQRFLEEEVEVWPKYRWEARTLYIRLPNDYRIKPFPMNLLNRTDFPNAAIV